MKEHTFKNIFCIILIQQTPGEVEGGERLPYQESRENVLRTHRKVGEIMTIPKCFLNTLNGTGKWKIMTILEFFGNV